MTPADTRGGYAREALWFPLETLESTVVLRGNIKYYPIFPLSVKSFMKQKRPE